VNRMVQENEKLHTMDRAFEIMVVLLTIFQASLLQYLIWLTDPKTERLIATRFVASLTIPLLICVGVWFYKSFVFTRTKRIVLCLVAFSMLGSILYYFIILFSIIVMLDLIASFPQIGAIMMLVLVYIAPSAFPYKKIQAKYRAANLDLDFWEKGRLYRSLPFVIGTALADVPILLSLIVPL